MKAKADGVISGLEIAKQVFERFEKDIVWVGAGKRIEIWNPDKWAENTEYDDMDEIAEHMSELGI